MKISACQTFTSKPVIKKSTNQSSQNRSKTISFEGKPYYLPKVKVKTAYDAMMLFSFLSLGNYLDSSEDDVSPMNKKIRDENLKFLDELSTQEDKKNFINHYKEVTGFPDLKLVSEKIEKEFILGIKKSSVGIEGAECIGAGYDGTCSVGKRKAFPGSDLDKSFIILQGKGNLKEDENIVNAFKSNLWNNIDQRLLSFNHDISFPSVYTVAQILDKMEKINQHTESIELDENHLQYLINNEYENFEAAAEYNIMISKLFSKEIQQPNAELTKEDVKNMAYFLESIRDGKYLIDSPQLSDLKTKLNKSTFYKYSNVAQMTAMRNAVDEGRENKTKILIRENMDQTFNSWDTDKQLEFIKTLIKYSCEDNDKFKEYFTNDRDAKNAYKPLLNILTQGDRNIYNRLEYNMLDNGINITYAEGKSVNVYSGYENNVLWIDSDDNEAIRQVTRNIWKLKQNDRFANVDRIQCVQTTPLPNGFYPINFTTADGKNIMEKML